MKDRQLLLPCRYGWAAEWSGSTNVDGAEDFELLDDGSGSVNVDNIRGNR